ncbi:MAG: 2,5-diamino-6-hydroxy-4-(5-phosphoribosylamino)pyrimidine 1''-reductase, archaeal [uncultured archaeon A07HR60]|jgi:2,5-diamino-6-(5-phosphoribosylamino)pyrimidin-4(3H)-one reductase (EC 1.1.1.-)|nr:MAG: 2,5-diamino-6-hydroxy-4-(5-phosphoribosylamino)pyrimidine 1''-reductase, archaeal [Halorubrum sp. J07HR59]ESS12318.1 MAG: 2,5-diamino-6-hydroxy-4-(5-phosphoribosylamino)pyrimidine 1''-reductase, archaeal [uncultured archaeon A07HR60]
MHIAVNTAVSADGKLSTHRREQLRISGSEDFDRVDRLRAAADGILVGVGTVLADDPHLTLSDEDRRVERLRNGRSGNPARVIADSSGRTPADARILDDEARTVVLTAETAPDDRHHTLEAAGADVLVAGSDRVDLASAIDQLDTQGLDRLMVEGGGEIIFSLFEAGLVDELTVYVGSLVVGGDSAPTLADGTGFTEEFPHLELTDVDRVDDGVLLSYTVGETVGRE